jgi:hypothetical protein
MRLTSVFILRQSRKDLFLCGSTASTEAVAAQPQQKNAETVSLSLSAFLCLSFDLFCGRAAKIGHAGSQSRNEYSFIITVYTFSRNMSTDHFYRGQQDRFCQVTVQQIRHQ